jgi:hypothetical protein
VGERFDEEALLGSAVGLDGSACHVVIVRRREAGPARATGLLNRPSSR